MTTEETKSCNQHHKRQHHVFFHAFLFNVNKYLRLKIFINLLKWFVRHNRVMKPDLVTVNSKLYQQVSKSRRNKKGVW